jgi:hypothetical protein
MSSAIKLRAFNVKQRASKAAGAQASQWINSNYPFTVADAISPAMTYAGLGMLMSNVISLHCERCGVGKARSLNALSYRNARSDPVPDGKAKLNDRARSWNPSALHRAPPSRDAVPLLPCGPFSAAKPSRPALSKHKSIVRPPLNFQCQSSPLSSPPFDLLSFDLPSKAPYDKICCLELLHECLLFDYRDHVRQLLVSAGRGR